MSFTSELTLDRAADIVFGDAVQLVDWQSGIASVVPLLSLAIEPAQIVRFEAERLVKLRQNGAKSLEHFAKIVAGKPNGFVQECEFLRKGVNCFDEAARIARGTGSSQGLSEGDRGTREALWDLLEDDARELEKMRVAFRAEIQADSEGLDALQRQQLDQAEKMLSDGLMEPPLERSRVLREARRLFRELTSEGGVTLSCAIWAQYCWLTWQLTANEEETLIPLEFAVSQTSSASGPGKSLCARLYAYLLCRLDRFDEAYQWSYAAVSVWPCLGTFHERARYAALTGRMEVARKELDALIQCSPLGILIANCDPVFAPLAPDLLEGSIRDQMRLRQLARQEIAGWEAVVRKSSEVRRRIPSISLPHDLTDGVVLIKAESDQSSFLCAAQQARRAGSAREDLKCITIAAIQSEKRRRVEAVSNARKSIEAAIEGRDDWIKASFAAHEEALKAVRSMLSKSDSKGEKAQKGCGWGMSTGCAALMGYGLLATILSTRGIMIGPRTAWGMVMLTLAGLPILIALIFHIVYSARRMILDAQVQSQISASSEQYDRSREEANEHFRGMIEASQEQLIEEEKQLSLVEEAARIFA